MNVMDLQASLHQKNILGNSDILTFRSYRRADGTSTSGGTRTDAPSFSDVLAALTRKNEASRTAAERTAETTSAFRTIAERSTETTVASRTIAEHSAETTATPRTAAGRRAGAGEVGNAEAAEAAGTGAASLLPDLSSTEAREILRRALSEEEIPTELLQALTDPSGENEFAEDLLDLILLDPIQEDETAAEGMDALGSGYDLEDVTTMLMGQNSALQAHEILSTQSGRELVTALAQNGIAGIVTS